MEITETTLEKITLTAQITIPARLAEDFAIEPQIRTFVDEILRGFIIQVRQSILSQKLDEVIVSYPADWWQAVKERFAPRWFLRRWPVEWNKTVVDVRTVYPKMALPDEIHFPLTRVMSDDGAVIDGWGEYTT